MSLLLIVFSSLKASGVGDVPVCVQVHVAGPDLSWRLVLNHTRPALELSSPRCSLSLTELHVVEGIFSLLSI